MRLQILYRPNSEKSRGVEQFVRDFKYQHESIADKVEIIDYDTREGVAIASIYDIMRQPAIIILNDDGSIIKYWEGDTLPLMDEVAGYIYSAS